MALGVHGFVDKTEPINYVMQAIEAVISATVGFGLTVPFWIAALALVLTAIMVAVVLPREPASSATTSWWQVARDQHALNLLRHTELRMLFIVQLAFTCGVTAFYEYYPLWLVEVAGYGARGMVWALLLAELLAAQLEEEPLPLERELVTALDPARFLFRRLRRG